MINSDGFGGGWDREQVLHIMKDSRLGSYGACALVAALGLKFLLLGEVAIAWLPLVLVAGHATSRFLSGSLLRALDYVRDDEQSKSKPLATRLGPGPLLFSALWPAATLLPLALLWDWRPVVLLLVLLPLLRLHLVHWFARRIGGYTGDCLGAAQQLAELLCYLIFALPWDTLAWRPGWI